MQPFPNTSRLPQRNGDAEKECDERCRLVEVTVRSAVNVGAGSDGAGGSGAGSGAGSAAGSAATSGAWSVCVQLVILEFAIGDVIGFGRCAHHFVVFMVRGAIVNLVTVNGLEIQLVVQTVGSKAALVLGTLFYSGTATIEKKLFITCATMAQLHDKAMVISASFFIVGAACTYCHRAIVLEATHNLCALVTVLPFYTWKVTIFAATVRFTVFELEIIIDSFASEIGNADALGERGAMVAVGELCRDGHRHVSQE